jgi:DNA-binding NtrC family response regulator
MRGFDERYLRWLLGETRGNVSAAARRARTERRHLGRLIRRIGIDPNAFQW